MSQSSVSEHALVVPYLIAVSITEICLHYGKCNEMCVIGYALFEFGWCLLPHLAQVDQTRNHVFVRFDAHEKVLIEGSLPLNQKFSFNCSWKL